MGIGWCRRLVYILFWFGRITCRQFLNPENANVSRSVATDVCLEVRSSVHLSKSFPLFRCFSPLYWFLCSRCHVIKDLRVGKSSGQWRSWWRRRPCSESDTGWPSVLAMWAALEVARVLRRWWKSWEMSPYWPATKQLISPIYIAN